MRPLRKGGHFEREKQHNKEEQNEKRKKQG